MLESNAHEATGEEPKRDNEPSVTPRHVAALASATAAEMPYDRHGPEKTALMLMKTALKLLDANDSNHIATCHLDLAIVTMTINPWCTPDEAMVNGIAMIVARVEAVRDATGKAIAEDNEYQRRLTAVETFPTVSPA